MSLHSSATYDRRRAALARRRQVRRRRIALLVAVLSLVWAAVALASDREGSGRAPGRTPRAALSSLRGPAQDGGVAGVPPLLDSRDVYAADRPGRLAAAVRGVPERVYVPNTRSDTVSVIDPATFKVIGRFKLGRLPQHVVPSYDLRTLWATNDYGNSLTPIDPRSGRPGTPVSVADPYNMYFTADGRFAIVVAEALERLDFRDAHTMRLRHSVHVSCQGVDHMDFSADGRFALASCEFSGQLLWVDVAHQRLARVIRLGGGSMPQDVKLSPDGKSFYVADKATGGVHVLDARSLAPRRFIRTGSDAHGLYVSRDSRSLYVSNRGVGTVSVISFAAQRVIATWRIPGGGSPDMGGVSADGKVLWLAGRYHSEVYALDTRTGRLLARIPVGLGPHGLAIFPQPGRYSLGHTGVFR